MPFSGAHWAKLRPLIDAAWALHCHRNGCNERDKNAYDVWYRGHLKAATGKTSTTQCNGGRNFEQACARFEELAESGYEMQLRLITGDLKRIRHAIQRVYPPFLKQFTDDQALHAWLRGIARQVTNAGHLPDLHELDDAQIQVVTQIARTAANDSKPEGTKKR